MAIFYDDPLERLNQPIKTKSYRKKQVVQRVHVFIFDNWKLILLGILNLIFLIIAIVFAILFFVGSADCAQLPGKIQNS